MARLGLVTLDRGHAHPRHGLLVKRSGVQRHIEGMGSGIPEDPAGPFVHRVAGVGVPGEAAPFAEAQLANGPDHSQRHDLTRQRDLRVQPPEVPDAQRGTELRGGAGEAFSGRRRRDEGLLAQDRLPGRQTRADQRLVGRGRSRYHDRVRLSDQLLRGTGFGTDGAGHDRRP